jgi:anti-sigma regulatory factor (Ser/Thr protein kinase)
VSEAAAHIDLPALPTAPGWARRHVEAVLGAWHIPPGTIQIAALLCCELVTNALAAATAQARPADDPATPGAIVQTLRLQPGQIVIEVSDPDPRPPVPMEAPPDAESGRGLMLVQAFAKEWSYFLLPSGGKTVYCACVIEEPP